MTDSTGSRLRQARELRRLTLQQVSETTKVRAHYLQALESDDYSAIPSAAQARGFLRIYAEFLELDPSSLLPAAQVAPVAEPAAPVASQPAAPQAPRPSLLTGLRERLMRRFIKDTDSTSFPTGLALTSQEQPAAEQAAALPATTDSQTTRRIPKAKPVDVKKNAGA